MSEQTLFDTPPSHLDCLKQLYLLTVGDKGTMPENNDLVSLDLVATLNVKNEYI